MLLGYCICYLSLLLEVVFCDHDHKYTFYDGQTQTYFHFSSENPLILILIHLKFTYVRAVVEVWEEAVTLRAAASISYCCEN